MNTLPVVVVGAGPAGLAAAAHLVERGVRPIVLDAGRVELVLPETGVCGGTGVFDVPIGLAPSAH